MADQVANGMFCIQAFLVALPNNVLAMSPKNPNMANNPNKY